MKDEGFLTAAGWRFVIFGAILIVGGVLAYFLLAEDLSIDLDLDQLTESSTTSTTTDFDFTVPDVTVPEASDLGSRDYQDCISESDTVNEILDCTNK